MMRFELDFEEEEVVFPRLRRRERAFHALDSIQGQGHRGFRMSAVWGTW